MSEVRDKQLVGGIVFYKHIYSFNVNLGFFKEYLISISFIHEYIISTLLKVKIWYFSSTELVSHLFMNTE